MRSRRFIGAVLEQAALHQAQGRADGRSEVHQGEDLPVEIDPGRDLDQLQPAGFGEAEDAALGDVEHTLARAGAPRSPLKVRCSTSLTNLRLVPSLRICTLPSAMRSLQVAGGEGADEHHLARRLADVDEAAGARQPRCRTGSR